MKYNKQNKQIVTRHIHFVTSFLGHRRIYDNCRDKLAGKQNEFRISGKRTWQHKYPICITLRSALHLRILDHFETPFPRSHLISCKGHDSI